MGQDNTRPSVLQNVSTSQMEELEEHFTGGDKDAWGRLTNSYGWSTGDSEAVWKWFSERPEAGSDAFSSQGTQQS